MDKNNIEECTGFVVLLDALGMKERMRQKENESIEIINQWKETIDNLQSTQQFLKQGLNVTDENRILSLDSSKFKIKGFSDTIIITVETGLQNDNMFNVNLADISLYLSMICYISLSNNILFRGAISYGKFNRSETMVSGRAMNEAASWFEELDMIGVMSTPNLSFKIDQITRSEQRDLKYLVKYDNVILKRGLRGKLWLINWIKIAEIIIEFPSLDEILLKIYNNNLITPDIYSKYENTYNFINWYREKNENSENT